MLYLSRSNVNYVLCRVEATPRRRRKRKRVITMMMLLYIKLLLSLKLQILEAGIYRQMVAVAMILMMKSEWLFLLRISDSRRCR